MRNRSEMKKAPGLNALKAAALMLVFAVCLMISGRGLIFAASPEADLLYTNSTTGYIARIVDDADLLTQAEEDSLLAEMTPVTEHCNYIIYLTKQHGFSSTESFAKSWYNSNYGSNSDGTMMVIDRELGYLWIYSTESIYRSKLTTKKANVIADNIYSEAANHRYYSCLSKGTEQIIATLEGNRIAQPMKYISNACIAAVVGLIIAYLVAMTGSAAGEASNKQIEENLFAEVNIANARALHKGTTRKYSPRSSGGGGGSRGGGGGHGGGGGGGGHRI